MATLRNKRKLAAVTRETQEENPRNGQSRNTSVPRINEEHIAQVSEEIEGRVTKKLSREYRRTESSILGALTNLDEVLPNRLIHTHFETVPGTFRSTKRGKPGNEWGRLPEWSSFPHPEAGIFRGQTTQNFGPKNCRDIRVSWNISFSNQAPWTVKPRSLQKTEDFRNIELLPRVSKVQKTYQAVRNFPKFLAEKLGNQCLSQETQEFRGSQTLGTQKEVFHQYAVQQSNWKTNLVTSSMFFAKI